MNGTNIVEFQQVGKDYPQGWFGRDRLQAVGAVSFAIAPGEVFGLLGPNRAGKTTLVKLLLSLCKPSRGQVLRLGKPASDRSTLAKVGYVHENQAFPRYLTARQILEFYGALSLLTEPVVRAKVPPLLAQVGLADRADEPIARFSKGMVQRLGIAQALLSDPDLLVLDEPNEGLDLVGRKLVRDLVQEHKSKGKAVLFVSHVLQEVDALCDKVGVIQSGAMVYLGSKDELKGQRSLEDALADLYQAKRN